MKRSSMCGMVCAVVVVGTVGAGVVRAADPAPAPVAGPSALQPAEDVWAKYAAERLRQLTDEARLTEGQLGKVKAILDEERAAYVQWDAEYRAAADAVRTAARAPDRASMERANEPLKALQQRRNDMIKSYRMKIAAELSPDQQAAWDSFQAWQTLSYGIMGCDLTEDQKTRARGLCREAAAQQKVATNDTARADIQRKLRDRVRTEILTPEQCEDVDGYVVLRRVKPRYAGLELTAAQEAGIKALCNQAAKKAAGQPDGLRRGASRAAHEVDSEVEKTILTQEQRDQLQGLQVYWAIVHNFPRDKVTPGQDAKIKALCVEAARREAGMDATARAAARKELVEKIKATVLAADAAAPDASGPVSGEQRRQ